MVGGAVKLNHYQIVPMVFAAYISIFVTQQCMVTIGIGLHMTYRAVTILACTFVNIKKHEKSF